MIGILRNQDEWSEGPVSVVLRGVPDGDRIGRD